MGFFRKCNPSAAAEADAAAEVEDLDHSLEPGDHVLRWTKLVLYPLQIHGIVLSAGAGTVTIIDFGLSSGGGKGNQIVELDRESRDRRLNIITLTEQKEVAQWKKVNYGESLLSAGKWSKITSWFFRKGQPQTPSLIDDDTTMNGEVSTMDDKSAEKRSYQDFCRAVTPSEPPLPPPDEIFARQKKDAEGILSWLEEESDGEDAPGEADFGPEDSGDDKKGNSEPGLDSSESKQQKSCPPPRLPKSDPPAIVLSRVRFLLGDLGRSTLPPHHLLYANSECIAVWCKTGRFSTLQSQIFLHSSALGNAKTATTVALIVGAQTVTVTSTVPAAGLWGWLGFTATTTSQVGLLSAQPWLIPLLAGYGIAAVGTPYLILLQAQGKWEKATSALTDAFWRSATADVYVDAIRHWSGLNV